MRRDRLRARVAPPRPPHARPTPPSTPSTLGRVTPRARAPAEREEASSDALGLGGLDLAQYVQKAQAYLQQRAAEKAANGEAADTEIAQLVNAALSKRGADGEGEAAADAQPEA